MDPLEGSSIFRPAAEEGDSTEGRHGAESAFQQSLSAERAAIQPLGPLDGRPPGIDAEPQVPQYDDRPIMTYAATRQQDHLSDVARNFDQLDPNNPGPISIHARVAFRHPAASRESVRLALHQDMNARRMTYHATNPVGRYLRSLAGMGLESPLDAAINYALALTEGHSNARLVADVISTDDEVRRRLAQRASDRSGRSNRDILDDRLQAHRQTMPEASSDE